ncbi:hypothetical protein KHX94_06415 [Shewanella dokdonensis]|uniref:Uncharacterized protein n=1 Tax=Shewanella dokdonensis TaxID=712036 RepID=A0ABX8DHF2_9GAMM|nr:hypothetical protein [Shewanella dokdonensis]QVK24199.1 hypothetical protein KHX94_06415 [Shewanella dokdonensis]
MAIHKGDCRESICPHCLHLLLAGCGSSDRFWISRSSSSTIPEGWTAFVYHHGFGSANYLKKEGFATYQQCREYAVAQSTKYENAPWECGGGCRFDSRRQGYVCEEMRNH